MVAQNSYKLNQKINIVGKTTDGKIVLKNAFVYMSTVGLPMDILLIELDKRNFIIDWIDFCKCALLDGWKRKTIYNKIKTGSEEAYTKEYSDELLSRINTILDLLTKGE